MNRKVLVFILFFCFSLTFLTIGNISAEEEVTGAEFVKHLADSMGVTYRLGESPKTEDYVNLLRKEGIKFPSGFDTNETISKDEKADLLNQVLSIDRRRKEEGREIMPIYRNKAVVIRVQGNVMVKREGETEWISAKLDMELTQGDYIKTGKDSSALLRVGIVGRIEVKENSELLLETLASKPDRKAENIILYLALGEIFVDVRDLDENSDFEIQTPTTVAAVRGTTYIVKVEPVHGKTEIREEGR